MLRGIFALVVLTILKQEFVLACDDSNSVLCNGTIVSYLYGIRVFILSDQGIGQLEPRSLDALTNFTKIDLSRNQLKEVRKDVFSGLNIITLDLSSNRITSVDSEAFDNMTNLRYLNLNNNLLELWDPDWFKNSTNLHEVTIKRNRLVQLPSNAFKNIVWIHNYDVFVVVKTTIDLQYNQISELAPDVFGGATEIGVVNFGHNYLKELPKELFGNVTFMELLDLSYNQLSCDALRTVLNFEGLLNVNVRFQRNETQAIAGAIRL